MKREILLFLFVFLCALIFTSCDLTEDELTNSDQETSETPVGEEQEELDDENIYQSNEPVANVTQLTESEINYYSRIADTYCLGEGEPPIPPTFEEDINELKFYPDSCLLEHQADRLAFKQMTYLA